MQRCRGRGLPACKLSRGAQGRHQSSARLQLGPGVSASADHFAHGRDEQRRRPGDRTVPPWSAQDDDLRLRVGCLERLDHGDLAVDVGAQPGRKKPAAGIGGAEPGKIGPVEVDGARLAGHVLDQDPQAERFAVFGQAQPRWHPERGRDRYQHRFLLPGFRVFPHNQLVDLGPARSRDVVAKLERSISGKG